MYALMLEFKIQIPHIIFKAIMIHNVCNENMSLIFSKQTLHMCTYTVYYWLVKVINSS